LKEANVTFAAMFAPIATLVFLSTLWLLVVLGATLLEESGARIAAALKGEGTKRPSAACYIRRGIRRSAVNETRLREERMRAAA
jgi:hypothetical protein